MIEEEKSSSPSFFIFLEEREQIEKG